MEILLDYIFPILLFLSLFNSTNGGNEDVKFIPEWDSLNSRINPEWYDTAKVGIMIHWGVYSVIPTGDEWFWYYWKNGSAYHTDFMNKHYKPGFTYADFAKDFKCERFEPIKWVKLFEESGAKYVVLTSKSHDGYNLFQSNYNFGWNSLDVGPHQNLVQELKEAVKRNSTLTFGLYYSLMEWFNPKYVNDKRNNFQTSEFVDEKIWSELSELVVKYQPDVLWSDGDWEALDTYWKSKEFLAWLFNESPVKKSVVTNDRWGLGSRNKNGGVWTGQNNMNPGQLTTHKFENAMPTDGGSWRYRADATLDMYRTNALVIKELVTTISCNGNFLLNIGPTKYGTIPPVAEERLRTMGEFLRINGDAIYGSTYWTHQNDSLSGDTW